MKPVMIGQLASETSTKVTTIRFYESIGLLRSAPRTASGRRTYDASDIERLHFIRNGRRLGFSVDEIRSLMGLAQNPDQDCGAASAIAAQHLKDVEAPERPRWTSFRVCGPLILVAAASAHPLIAAGTERPAAVLRTRCRSASTPSF